MDLLLIFFIFILITSLTIAIYLSYLSKQKQDEIEAPNIPPDPIPTPGAQPIPVADLQPTNPDDIPLADLFVPFIDIPIPADPTTDLLLTVINGEIGKGGRVLTYDADFNLSFQEFESLDSLPSSAYFVGKVTEPEAFQSGLNAKCQFVRLYDRYTRLRVLDHVSNVLTWSNSRTQNGFNWLYFDFSNTFANPAKVISLRYPSSTSPSIIMNTRVLSTIDLSIPFRDCLSSPPSWNCKTPVYIYSPNSDLSEYPIIEPKNI